MSDKLKISACFIVRDEERFIGRALESVRPFVDEIVVLDTGSADATMEIAGRYADKMGSFEWCGDFSAARNTCAALAGHDWIFSMDADEEITHFDLEGIRRALEENPSAVGRYSIRNMTDSEPEPLSKISRVYDRRMYHYEGTIHEMLAPLSDGGRPMFDLPVVADHHGYRRDVAQSKDKTTRNRSLLLKELERDPLDAYYHFQLGKNYSYAGDKAQAIRAFKRALALNDDTRLEYVANLVEAYGNDLLALERYDEAAELLVYANRLNSPRSRFAFGMICMNIGRFDDAVSFFESGIVKGSTEPMESCMPRYNIGVIYECTGRIKDAIAQYSACGDFLPALTRLRALR